MNGRGKPLASLAVIVSRIGATTSKAGLRARAEIDKGRYPDGFRVTDEQRATTRRERHEFPGDGNSTLRPHRTRAGGVRSWGATP